MTMKSAATLLRLNGIGFILFAAVWWLAVIEPASGPALALIDFLKWPLDGDPSSLDQIDRWLSAIGAGLTFAFGVFTLTIVAPGVEDGDMRVRNGAIATVLAWFVADSAGSILSGVGSNAAFNLIFLALYLAPLVLVRAGAGRPARA